MADAPLRIVLSEPCQAGLIIMRPHEDCRRGALLINVAETEARIKFLPGYLSASFFTDARGSVLAEYVRWQSAQHLGAAFVRPEFQEHLPVVGTMAPHPALSFGPPTVMLNASGDAVFDLAADHYAMSILRVEAGALDTAMAALANWYRSMLGDRVDAVILHKDGKEGQIAILAAGRRPDIPPPPATIPGATLIEHAGSLRLYSTVLAGRDPALALHYAMVPTSGL